MADVKLRTEQIEDLVVADITDITATVTEINYTDGVTSAIQTQLGTKAPLASPTFTGTVAGITATMVGLGNVDNTSNATERTATATLTNKRIQPRTSSSTTSATLTPDLSVASIFYRTTQTETLTINACVGTPVIGETIYIEVNSAGAETLTINATYIPFGAAFPATTTAGKTFLMTCTYNGTNWRTLWSNEV